MSYNLADTIRERLNIQTPLEKIDPNSPNTPRGEEVRLAQPLVQSAIVSILTGLYKFTRELDGSAQLLNTEHKANWPETVFREKAADVIHKVVEYAHADVEKVRDMMNAAGNEAVGAIHENAAQPTTAETIRDYLSSQRHDILVYLPAGLQLGPLLEDETLDDSTNKMEGPVSNFMHTIEGLFSEGKSK